MTYKSNIDKVTRITEAEEFPEVILIDNFNGCNLQCSICDHKNMYKHRPIQRMDFALYRKIIDEIAERNNTGRSCSAFREFI